MTKISNINGKYSAIYEKECLMQVAKMATDALVRRIFVKIRLELLKGSVERHIPS